jgi:transcription initiation factor TFIIIB Brf1 subunit/transcription initiation factor TFIIB
VEARFESKCAACGEQIHEGDEIVRDSESAEWLHEDCAEVVEEDEGG